MKKISIAAFFVFVLLLVVKISFAAELPEKALEQKRKCGWIRTESSPVYNCAPIVYPDVVKIKRGRWAYDKSRVIYVYDIEGDPFTFRIEGQLPPGLKYGRCPKEGVGYVECYILGIARRLGKYQLEFFTKDKLGFEDQKTVTIEVVR